MKRLTRNIGLIFMALMLTVFTGCKEFYFDDLQPGKDGIDGIDGINGLNAAMRLYVFGPDYDETYPAGGVQYESGLDANRNDILDDDEVNPNLTFVVANGLDGQNGVGAAPVIPTINSETGTWWIAGQDTGFQAVAVNGTDGNNGFTPYIGGNGNWWINGTDTGYASTGTDGADGADGKTGGTPYPFITEIEPNQTHLNGGWMYTWYVLDESLELTEDSQFIGSYPVWHGNDGVPGNDGLDGAPGTDGLSPYVGEDGYWYIGLYNTGTAAQGEKGDPGAPGADGLTPYVGQNGNWWIGFIDTGYQSQGAPGADGVDGEDGAPGSNGLTPYIGENGNWWIGGFDTFQSSVGTTGADGEDGKSPFIGENNYWYVWSDNEGAYINTGVYSIGAPGANGTDGLDGADGAPGPAGADGETPYVGDNGNWWISNVDTGYGATGATGPQGPSGEDGADGLSPFIGPDGSWYIWITIDGISIPFSTYISATGEDGAPGSDGQDGAPGTPGDDGVSVVDIILTEAEGCGANGGLAVTLYLSDDSEYTFEVCNGEDGTTPEVNSTNGGCLTLANVYLTREDFDNESLPYGWEGQSAQLYSFIPNQLVVKANTYLKTNLFNPTSVTEVSIDAAEYVVNAHKYIQLVVERVSGEETIGDKILVYEAYHNNLDNSQTIKWTGIPYTDIVRIKFLFTTDGTSHNKKKVVIDNVNVIGDITYCTVSDDN